MQEYMKLFGSEINFYDGPGESAHKQIIKIPGQRLSTELVSLHSRLHFNTTTFWLPVMLHMAVRSDPICTNSQEILAQILTVLKQKEMFSSKCQKSMILQLLVK